MISEEPTSWDSLDGRGNPGDANNNDRNLKASVSLTGKSSSSYSTFEEDMSTVKLKDYSDK